MKAAKDLAEFQSLTLPAKQERFPYWMRVIVLFCLGWTVIYINRTVLNPVMGDIKAEFSLTNAQLGLINSLFFLPYTFMQIPSGIMADKLGKKLVLIPGFILFAIGQFSAGLMTTFFGFLIARLLTGVGQGSYYGPQYAMSSESIPVEKRGVSTAIINSGAGIGMAIGLMGASFLAYNLHLGWRVPFYASAVLGLLLSIAFWLFLKEKPETVAVNKEIDSMVIEEDDGTSLVKALLTVRMLATYAVNFASNYGFYMILTWLPFYLETERGIPADQTGFFSSLVAFAAIPGAVIFSRFSDKLGRRKPFIIFLLPLAAASLALIVFVKSWTLVVFMLVIYGLIGKLALDPIMISFVADAAPKRGYSTIFSVFNCAGMAASIVAPLITGYISDITGSMRLGFYLAAVLLIVGLVTILFINEKKRG
ncbi:MFS transporter [Bacillus rubiinfantis]|uniref:MFS transporter n=1 Tax=Bacillus rubiinfantis TaxID=1499680 RepID=UPI0005A95FD5|nr:MFS transporter [Bacillus rubiinfantis]